MSVDDSITRRSLVAPTRIPIQRPAQDVPQRHEKLPRFRSRRLDVVPSVVFIDSVALPLAAIAVNLSPLSTLLMVPLVLALNAGAGQYRWRLAPSLLDELPGLVARAFVAGAVVTALRVNASLPVRNGPVFAAIAFLALACLGRAVLYPLIRRHRARRSGRATVIIGCGRIGDQLAMTLLEHPELGLRPVGYVDDDPLIPAGERRLPLLGGTESLGRVLRTHQVHNVIVAFARNSEAATVDMLRTCDRLACEIFFVPRLYELHGAGRDTEYVWGLPLMRLRRATHRTISWRTKRAFDFLLAGIGLIVLSPVLALCALAVRLEGGPGIIFRQERVGLDGRHFMILKFRSLKPVDDAESAQCWNIGDDARLGPVGKTIRRLSLDELPQLWNVVRGDMSLVGPRPERPVFVQEFTERIPRYVARHRVPAGLTGWAQVHGLRGDTDISERVTFDNYYIENWGLWTDIKIILRTVAQVVGARGR